MAAAIRACSIIDIDTLKSGVCAREPTLVKGIGSDASFEAWTTTSAMAGAFCPNSSAGASGCFDGVFTAFALTGDRFGVCFGLLFAAFFLSALLFCFCAALTLILCQSGKPTRLPHLGLSIPPLYHPSCKMINRCVLCLRWTVLLSLRCLWCILKCSGQRSAQCIC